MSRKFNRLLDAVAELDDGLARGVVQYGYSDCSRILDRPHQWDARHFMTDAELGTEMEKADIVISHAGVGTILKANALRKRLIICPRLHMYDEHVDDHQLQITNFISSIRPAGILVSEANYKSLGDAIHEVARCEVVDELINPYSIQAFVKDMIDAAA
jgi:UDP-N-acetylglucosamine transferase subunit ALG13